VGGGAGHERVVLVAAGDVHVDLAVGVRGRLLVEAGVMGVHSEMRQTLIHRIFLKRTNYACLMVSNCSLVYSV